MEALCTNFSTASPATKQQAAEELNAWFHKFLQSKSENAPSLQELTDLFKTTCENLTDAKPRFTQILKDLLKNILSLRQKFYSGESVEPWVRFLVQFPATSKALYHALEPLAKYVPAPYEYGLDDQLYKTAFTLFASLQIASPVGKCLSALFKFRGDPKDTAQVQKWVLVWSPYVYATFGTKCRENALIYVLGPLLAHTPQAFPYFYARVSEIEDQIGCLKTANDVGIDVEPFLVGATTGTSLLHSLHNISRFLRYEVLALLIESRHVAKPISQHVYQTIIDNADVLFCEANPKFRNQVYAILRKFLFRVRSSSYAQARDSKGQPNEYVHGAQKFVEWMLQYMLQQLQPGCPYRSLVTGFQYIELLAIIGVDSRLEKKYLEPSPVPFPFSVELFNEDLLRLLINNVPNDYYDIRQLAAKLIQMAPHPVPFLETEQDVDKIEQVSRSLISGVRGRQGDGGARISQIAYQAYSTEARLAYLQNLITELEDKIELTEADIRVACQEHGLHGYFQALSLIFEVADFASLPSDLVPKLIATILKVWDVTWETLTNSAPEGNIPMPLDAMMEEDEGVALSGKYGATAQVLLSFSWRAVKESATLLTVLVNRSPVLSDKETRQLLDIVVRNLTSIRHRGAYSSLAPTYEALCSRCYKCGSLENLPLEKLMLELDNVIVKTQLITRRSAGLPMLISGAISTHPKQKQMIEAVMTKLFEIASIPVPSQEDSIKLDLPQVHAFNCIRGALRESRLTKGTDAYVERALVLAIEAFSSAVWSIRNCGVMLFSTLHIRLFGTNSTMGAGVFFSRFKTIKPLLYKHLVDYVSNQSSADLETVYPILALLLRLRSIGDNSGLEPFCDPIMEFLSSKIWKVREMSAWVLAAIMHESQIERIAHKLLSECTTTRQNTLHGHLMALNAQKSEFTTEFIQLFSSKLPELLTHNPCFESKVEAVRLRNKLGLKFDLEQATEVGLNPSVRVFNSLVATPSRELLASDERDVVEAALAFYEKNLDAVDPSAYKAIVANLEHPVPNIKAQALDIIAALGVVEHGLSYDHVSQLVYNPKQPLSVQQRALKCLGSLIPQDSALVAKWQTTITAWCDEENPIDSRLCAVDSISAFLEVHKPNSQLLWIIYMLLSDDDETLREAASRVASKILGGCNYAPRYCEPLVLRLIDHEYIRAQFKQSVPEPVQSDEELLFASEKPNLYRDEYQQARHVRDILGLSHQTLVKGEPLGASANVELQLYLCRNLD